MNVRIEKLPPTRVAWVRSVSSTPERVGPEIVPAGAVGMKDFPGGLYAVTTCKVHGEPGVAETWRRLWEWVRQSSYRWRRTHELEKVLDPLAREEDLVLDLYLPIEE